MAQRSNQRDTDDVALATVGVPLGESGLDLRDPADPSALSKFLNGRFLDERSITQRNGHTGLRLRDGANLAPLGEGYSVSGDWVYGHGATVSSTNAAGWENAHHPFPGQARGVIRFGDSDVVWTGDRLLMSSGDREAQGSSAFWNRSSSTELVARGIPAYLPQQTDSTPPDPISGSYVETCLTTTLRVFVQCDGDVTAWVVDRATGVLKSKAVVSDVSNNAVEVRVVNSADTPVIIWRDGTSRVMYYVHWTGSDWSAEAVLQADVYAFDVAQNDSGFYLIWREGSPTPDAIKIGAFAGTNDVNVPFLYGTEITTPATPDGPVTLAVSPGGHIGVLLEAGALRVKIFTPGLAEVGAWATVSSDTVWDGGIALCSRGLRDLHQQYPWVVHASRGDTTGVLIAELTVYGGGITKTTATKYNSSLASKSFRAGDEVFCWLRSNCAGTHYLVAGSTPKPEICGYADREEATERATADGNYGIAQVVADPLDEDGLTFSWCRPYNTGNGYSHGGNVRVGDLSMLPEVVSVQYGKSVYFPGSAVRNWDGIELGDAGFQDYPIVASTANTTGGSLTTSGTYYFRVYAVRYNRRGERFQSAAITSDVVTLSGGENKVALTVLTVPSTNHDDVVLEVYRTEDLGTTFYLEGTIANSMAMGSVTYYSTISDADLRLNQADPHAPGVGQLAEIEEFGPVGCAVLAVSGDRLWAIGGQVPAGVAQFSKLKEEGEGAGFDALAGFQTIDTEGGALTAIHALNDTTVIHQERRLFVVAGTGPDNYGRGGFTVPQITLADGAVSQHTCLTQQGAHFWGKDGPRLIDISFRVHNISAPVRPLASTMTPSGVRASLAEHDVVWYTREGTALLCNYLGDNIRWGQWTGLRIAGCSSDTMVTTDGVLLTEDADAVGDAGQTFAFVWAMSHLRPERLLAGYTILRDVGIVGKFRGPHRLRIRIRYNGSPLWTDQWTWEPESNTWLTSAEDLADLVPSQIDALTTNDRSGAYLTHKRVSRPNCEFFSVEVSNIEATGPTYVPFELSLELGARGGLGRVPVNTFSDS